MVLPLQSHRLHPDKRDISTLHRPRTPPVPEATAAEPTAATPLSARHAAPGTPHDLSSHLFLLASLYCMPILILRRGILRVPGHGSL